MPIRFLHQPVRRLYHACWYLFAAVVLTSAVTITLIRLLLPHAGDYREEVQELLSARMGYAITIAALRGEWEGWVPTLYLDGIRVASRAGAQEITRLHSVTIRFDPFASFRHGELTPFQLIIGGPELTLIRNRDGTLRLALADEPAPAADGSPSTEGLAQWLLLQRIIVITGATVTYRDHRRDVAPVVLTGVELTLHNAVSHVQLNGSLTLPGRYGDQCTFALEVYGDITTSHWSGQMYVAGINLNAAAMLPHLDQKPSFQLSGAPLDLSLWSRWQEGRMVGLSGRMQTAATSLVYQAWQLDARELDVLFALERDRDQGWRLTLKLKKLLTTNHDWPETVISIAREQHGGENQWRYVVHGDRLQLRELLELTHNSLLTAKKFATGPVTASGTLQDYWLVIDPALAPDAGMAITGQLRDFSLGTGNQKLVIRNLDGTLSGNASEGLLRLDSPAAEIILAGAETHYLLNELRGDIHWQRVGDSVQLETAHLQAHTPHFHARLQGSLRFAPDGGAPLADLQAAISGLELEHLHLYLPELVPKLARDWIKGALIAGEAESADMVLRGPLADFPFDQHEGRFEILAAIHNGTLAYHPDWVPIDNIEAEVRIDGRNLTVDAHAGNIYNAEITHAQAMIEDLGKARAVAAQGTIKGQTGDALTFINNTPLSASTLLREVTRHKLDGAFTLDLDVGVPFHGMPVTYQGDLDFTDTTLNTSTLGIEIANISGGISFANDGVTTDQLTGTYAGEPVTLDIAPAGASGLTFGITGLADESFITAQLAHFFPGLRRYADLLTDRMSGSSAWTALLSPQLTTGGDLTDTVSLRISAPLSGLAIELPAPLGKKHEARALEITSVISPDPRKQVRLSYGDVLQGIIALDMNDPRILTGMELALGGELTPTDGITGINIHGQTAELSLSAWKDVIDSMRPTGTSGPAEDLVIDIATDKLELFGHRYTGMNFVLRQEPDARHLTLAGTDLDGSIVIPDNGRVRGEFKRIVVNGMDQEAAARPVNIRPQALPPLQVSADEFIYKDLNLGKMELTTSPLAEGMSIEQIAFAAPGVEINGKGRWLVSDGAAASEFTMNLDAQTLEEMLTTLNFSVQPVKDGAASFQLNASWPGGPMDFALSVITGSLNMQIGRGQFTELETRGGRLFGLLNLQTLIRLLSLDLTVLFSKGYTFDSIEGSFTLEAGNAYTNNLAIKGKTADINLSGRTGLIAKDYDQIATVSPHTLFGPVGKGIGAVMFLAGELFESLPKQIDKILRYQYSIKGSWEEPVIEKYNSEY